MAVINQFKTTSLADQVFERLENDIIQGAYPKGVILTELKLVEQLGGEVVKIIFLMELAGLNGREKLGKYDVESVITYEGK